MEKDLYKFYDMITFIGSKDVVTYEDEKGNLYTIPILQLILASEYAEYDDATLKTAIFENKIEIKIITITSIVLNPLSLSTITSRTFSCSSNSSFTFFIFFFKKKGLL